MSWTREGVITLTNGSKAVTGAGTTWLDNMPPSSGLITPTGTYEVESVSANGALQLVLPYAGPSVANVAYQAFPTQGYVLQLLKQAAALVGGYSAIKWAFDQGELVTGDDILGLLKKTDFSDKADVDKGTGMGGHNATLNYAVGTLGRVLNDVVLNVKMFPWLAKGDGIADDAPAINAAITAAGAGGRLVFPKGTYLCGSTLNQLQGQAWDGLGGQRSVTLKKGFNGDSVVMGSLGSIENINIEGEGANFSGRGFYVPSGFSHRLERCRAVNTRGPSLEFAVDAGGGAHVSDFEGLTTDPTNVAAVLVAGDTAPHPRFFDGLWLSGGIFKLGPGAGNGCSLTNFYIRNFLTTGPVSGGSVLMHVSNGRVASINDTTTISGADMQFANIAFSGPVYLNNAQGVQLTNCTYGAGITENPTNCQYNSFDTQARSYTPAWTQTGGGTPSIGNGELTAWFSRQGYTCTVTFRLVAKSATTLGDAISAYRFSLPFRGHQQFNQRGITAHLYDASAQQDYRFNASIGANEDTFTLTLNGQSMRSGYPVPLAPEDTLDLQFTYMVR